MHIRKRFRRRLLGKQAEQAKQRFRLFVFFKYLLYCLGNVNLVHVLNQRFYRAILLALQKGKQLFNQFVVYHGKPPSFRRHAMRRIYPKSARVSAHSRINRCIHRHEQAACIFCFSYATGIWPCVHGQIHCPFFIFGATRRLLFYHAKRRLCNRPFDDLTRYILPFFSAKGIFL